jgi:hypothetical protein
MNIVQYRYTVVVPLCRQEFLMPIVTEMIDDCKLIGCVWTNGTAAINPGQLKLI